MSVVKRLLLLILLLLILLLAVLTYATMTHGGMKRLFSLGQSYAQGELSWGDSSGRLLGPATLDDVLFVSDAGASVKIQKARFDWQPRQLLSRTLQVDDFDLSGITIRLPPPSDKPEEPTEPFQLRDLALPLGAEIQRVSLTDIKVYPYGAEEPIIVDAIKLSAGARDADLKLVELSISAPQGELSMDGVVNTSGDWPLGLNQQWRVDHPQFGEFSGNGSMQGNIKSLRLLHAVEGAATVDIDTLVNDVTGELSWDGSVAVNSDDLGVFSEGLNGIPVTVDALTSGNLKEYQATGLVKSDLSQTGPLTADFNVDGSLDELNITQILLELEQSTANAKLSGNVQFADLQSDITVQWTDVPWPLVAGQSISEESSDASAERSKPLALSPSGKLTFNGKPDEFNLKLDSLLTQDTAGELQLSAQVDGNPQLINIQSVTLKSLQGSTNLDVEGTIDVQNNAVEINGQWTELTWPLVETDDGAEKIFQSDTGSFSVTGPLDEYHVNAEIQVAGKDIPDGEWQLDATGNAESLRDIEMQGQTLDGVINGTGVAQWSPSPEWTIDLTADQINPAVKWPGLDGNIGLAVRSEGAITDAGPAVNVKILDLNGDYQKQALSGSGEINIVNGEIQIDRLDVKAGQASVNANGTLAETLDLDWKLDAPALEKLVPGISGDIDINGKIAGTVDSPASDFSVDIKNFQSDGVEVKTINGSGSVDLSGKAQSTLKLNVNEITAAGQVWDKLVIDGSGSPEKHKVNLSLVGEQADLSLSANGGVKENKWQGTLDEFTIDETPAGEWKLEKPVTITASAEQIEASRLCLVSDPSSLCVDGEWDASKGAAADIELKDLNAQRFQDYLPPDIEIDAALQGSAKVRTDASGAPEVTADFTIPGGSINYLDTGEPVSDKLGQSRLQFELKDDNLKSKVDLDLGPIGTVNTNTIIGGLSTTGNLSGTVKTDIEDMSLVSIFMPDLQAVDGKFDTDMTLSGTLDSPQVVGETGLNGLVTEVPAIAMKVLDGTMKAESDGKGGLKITGQATSGDGQLDITGVVNPSTGDMELVIKGEQFEVANTARQRAVVNPDLRVVINGPNITVTGEVHIPSAYIQTGGEAALVKESSDVIIVNSDEDTDSTKEESQVSLDVKVTLGDDIRVKAGPFDGALGGGLTVQQVPGRVPTGSGAIEVLSGDFLVYGQKLTMEQGRVLFAGGPIDNPALEIDVARDVVAYEVKAGARIRGTAQAPLLQLQSDPTQTDANTLSFILLGRPVDNVGASYTLGKFITPELYVSYGIDLFDKIQSFNLRYKISERLSLIGARSDETQGADLIYRIER